MTFAEWLAAQAGRNDVVGDFARDAVADRNAPTGGANHEEWRRYLKGAPDALCALDEAWREYQARK
jgi:uncharacterized protein YozE (UPF0346 family)